MEEKILKEVSIIVRLMNGMVYIDNQFQQKNIIIKNGRIHKIMTEEEQPAFARQEIDLKGQYVIPGMIDIHTHGAVGVDINHATEEGLAKISRFFATEGVTSWVASIVTDTKEQTLHIIQTIKAYLQKKDTQGARLLGIHLEGPFLAEEYKGSMPGHLILDMSDDLLDEYIEASDQNVKYITVAPEVFGVNESIPSMVEKEIAVSIGHSGASYEQAMQAIENGATASTHTFNAMRLLHQHEPAILGAVLEANQVYAEGIFDGFHLSPGIIRLLLKTKGIDKVVAITDSIQATGLGDGQFKLGVNDIVVKDGDAQLKANGVRAGSTLTMLKSLKNMHEFTDLSLKELLPMYTLNPAIVIGMDEEIGSISVGKKADFVILDETLNITNTIIDGVSQ